MKYELGLGESLSQQLSTLSETPKNARISIVKIQKLDNNQCRFGGRSAKASKGKRQLLHLNLRGLGNFACFLLGFVFPLETFVIFLVGAQQYMLSPIFLSEINIHKWLGRCEADSQSGKIRGRG